jgi:hypothetical protein
MARWILLLLVLVSPGSVLAQPPAAAPRVADLGWLAGHWQGKQGSSFIEEVWSQPREGSLLGLYRQLDGAKVVVYELLAVRDHEGGPELRFKHFRGDLVGWEEKDKPYVLKLVSSGPRAATFQGPGSEGEMTFEYSSPDPNQLVCKLTRIEDGKPLVEEYRYQRVVLVGTRP